MSITERKNRNYSEKFKISVIMDMPEQHLSYNETVRRYELGGVSRTAAKSYKSHIIITVKRIKSPLMNAGLNTIQNFYIFSSISFKFD